MIFINNHPISNRRYGGAGRNHNRSGLFYSANSGGVAPHPTYESYAQACEIRRQMIQQRRDHIEKRLRELPKLYTVSHCVAVLVIILILGILQIVQICNKAPSSNLGNGLWVGGFYLIAVGISIYMILKPSYNILMTTSAIYFIGFFVCLISMIATNPYNKDNSTNEINVVLITFESLLALLTVVFVCVIKSLTCYQPKHPSMRSFAINQNAIRLNTISENQNNQHGGGSGSGGRDSFASQVPPYTSFYGNNPGEELGGGEDLPPYNPEKFQVKPSLQDEAVKPNY